MTQAKRDSECEYLVRGHDGNWWVELPHTGYSSPNRVGDVQYAPIGLKGNSMKAVRLVAKYFRMGIESHHNALIDVFHAGEPPEKINSSLAYKLPNSTKEFEEFDLVGRLHNKAEKLVAGALAYSRSVMDRARETALACINDETPDRPYRDKISDGILPPIPRGDISMVAAKNEFENVCGIYFIHRSHQLVYVGLAENIASRISSHHVAALTDRICIVEVPADQLKQSEDFYIWSLRPPINKEWKHHYRDGELKASPLRRFVTEDQPKPTGECSLGMKALPQPHKEMAVNPTLRKLMKTPEVALQTRKAISLIREFIPAETSDPAKEIEKLLVYVDARLEAEAKSIAKEVTEATKGGED